MNLLEANSIIEEIMTKFDFAKCHAAMVLTDWKWHEHHVPSVDELRDCARRLLLRASEEKTDFTAGSGGLTVYKDKNEVNLVFELETYAVTRERHNDG